MTISKPDEEETDQGAITTLRYQLAAAFAGAEYVSAGVSVSTSGAPFFTITLDVADAARLLERVRTSAGGRAPDPIQIKGHLPEPRGSYPTTITNGPGTRDVLGAELEASPGVRVALGVEIAGGAVGHLVELHTRDGRPISFAFGPPVTLENGAKLRITITNEADEPGWYVLTIPGRFRR